MLRGNAGIADVEISSGRLRNAVLEDLNRPVLPAVMDGSASPRGVGTVVVETKSRSRNVAASSR